MRAKDFIRLFGVGNLYKVITKNDRCGNHITENEDGSRLYSTAVYNEFIEGILFVNDDDDYEYIDLIECINLQNTRIDESFKYYEMYFEVISSEEGSGVEESVIISVIKKADF